MYINPAVFLLGESLRTETRLTVYRSLSVIRQVVRQILPKRTSAQLSEWPPNERRTACSPAEAATGFQLSAARTIGWVLLFGNYPSSWK